MPEFGGRGRRNLGSMTERATAEIESERKYDVGESVVLPDFAAAGFAEARSAFTLRAIYYDTEDGVLAANRMTLRRREGGHDEGWHLKTPSGSDRMEHRSALEEGLPDALRAVVADLLGGRAVTPVAQLDTHRAIVVLSAPDGAELFEIADDRVSSVDLRAEVRRSWREWEAELLAGAPTDAGDRQALVEHVEELLVSAGATPSDAPSKLLRALGVVPLPAEDSR
jgi:inorganic triphosphatase YgiF